MLKALKVTRALRVYIKKVNLALKAFFIINKNKNIINNKLNDLKIKK
jgi:alkyl hydroperoxide reductase subunit AhpC